LYTTNPARAMNLPKGKLAVGSSADVTIFSTNHKWVYDVNQTCSKSKNSPFHGHEFKGGPVATIVGGKFVWKTGLI
jgi:dihydroorotase